MRVHHKAEPSAIRDGRKVEGGALAVGHGQGDVVRQVYFEARIGDCQIPAIAEIAYAVALQGKRI